jgi:hypothetical protein
MPYAAEDKISEVMIEGGIEITEQEYQEALQAMLEGKKIAIRDGMLRFLSSKKKTVYNTQDGSELEIPENEDVPDGYTEIEYPGELYYWQNGEWMLDIEKYKAKKIAELANARWREEVGGYMYNGHEFHSDRESQDRFFQAYMASLSDSNFTVTWKTKNGWLEMTASDFITLYNEFYVFLQNLYQKEKNLQEQIEAATTIEELEAIQW